MPDWLASRLPQYGYPIVFLGVLLENAGVPVPGETILLAAGFLAQHGLLSLPRVIALAAAAAILGDNTGYWVGRRGGRPLAERYGPSVGLTPTRLAALDAFFARHGTKTVFVARFVAGVRVFAALFAGIGRLPWRSFFLYNAAGALTWATAVALAGAVFGQSWDLLHRWIGRAGLFSIGAIVGAGLVVLGQRYWSSLVAKAERLVPAALTLREVILVGANLAAVGLFAKIVEDVVTRESTEFDRVVSLALHRFATPGLDRIMQGVSTLGSAAVVLPVVGLVIACAVRRQDTRAAAVLAAVAAVTEGVNAVLKWTFQRVRPSLWAVATLHSYSFPSGHAMAAVAIYGMAAVVAVRLWPNLARIAAIGTSVLAVLIGISRVYLGVHWPTDVLAGWAAGAFVLTGGVYCLYGRAGR
jgi:undecaprenyl-diphosphatase